MPRPKEVHLRGGPNVYWDSKLKGFRAKCAGRVSLRGQTLDIDQVYYVQNVGNKSGNIKHNGSLVVKEEVTNDYKIDVTGDIEIGGMVYACDIHCGGNLTTKEGIKGQLTKKVFVRGNLYTKCLQNANVESYGNIYANTEIYQSAIQTKGTVNCNEGRVIGGEILATKGITIGEAWSKGNVKTILIAGIDKDLQQKMKTNCDEITEMKKIIKKLLAIHRKLKANIRLLNPDQKEKMTQINSKIKEAEEEITKLENQNQEISQKIRDNSVARINILKIVYPGVVLRICQSQYLIESTLGGPVVAIIDPATHEIALTSDLKN